MNLSIFLAQALGLYLIFLSIAYILNRKRFKPLLVDMMNNPGLMFVVGVIALIMGILMVVSHNIWVKDWRIIITIIAWMALFKGINIIFFPNFLNKISKKWIYNNNLYYITFFFTILMGAVLLYFGYR